VYNELRKGMQPDFSASSRTDQCPRRGGRLEGARLAKGPTIKPELTRGIEPLTC
jgi:hypothetical protein